MAELSPQAEAAIREVPVAGDTRYEFSVFDEDYTEQAGGSAPTYAQTLSEGRHYLAQYQQDGPHTLEVRRVEVLNPDALPLLPDDAQPIEPAPTPAGGGAAMTIETATITVPKIRDNDGQPTCRWWDHHCPFLMQSGFGTREHCFWMEGSGKHRPQLERREHGIGTTIPHQQCPVWEVQE